MALGTYSAVMNVPNERGILLAVRDNFLRETQFTREMVPACWVSV